MSLFNYKAIKVTGEEYTASMDAPDKATLFRDLKERGDMVVHVEEVDSGSEGIFQHLKSLLGGILGHVSTQEKIIFAKNLGAMISAGLALSRALTVLERQSKNKVFKEIVVQLNENISRGKTLSEAMKLYPKVFSNLFVSMVKAGEESGGLSEALRVVATQMDNSNRLQKKIKGAMIYPSVIVCVILVVALMMLIFVIPQITATFKEINVELPLSTRIVIGTSDFMKDNSILAILILLVVIFGTYMVSRTKGGRSFIDGFILKLPIIGNLVRETNSARTARTLSSLLSSGVPVAESLSITSEVLQNHLYKKVIKDAGEGISKGQTISGVFMRNEKLYPVFVGEMMSVGEETGKMAEMLMGVATYYENEVEQKTKDMSTIIEPVLMVFIGAAVGFFAISMITPIYSMMDNV